MTQPEHVDVLVIGSGQGGKLLAWHLARSGRRVAVVERRWVGGSCPNVACMPSKNEIWSARVAHLATRGSQFGINVGSVRIDVAKVRERKRAMVERELAFHLNAFKTSGAELIMGSARFLAPRTVEVLLNGGGTRSLVGDQIVINVGTHPAIPDVPGLEVAQPLTHVEALELGYAPAHLIVLGGGYVGLELAQAYRRFGSRVTVVENGPQILSREDPDTAAAVLGILRDEGIDVLLATRVVKVDGLSGKKVTLTVSDASGERRIQGTDVLVAVGRIPNTRGIGLDVAGIDLDDRGYIRVNDRLQASVPDIWAIGECAGSPQFTHVSVDDFRIVRDNLTGGTRSTRDRLVPYCMFTDPPLAHVGLSEEEAKRRGIAVRVAKLPMTSVLRGEATDETLGFMKVLVSASDERILGFTMLGAEAGEVVAAVQTAMLAKLPYPVLRDAVITHLTYAEGLGILLDGIAPRAVS